MAGSTVLGIWLGFASSSKRCSLAHTSFSHVLFTNLSLCLLLALGLFTRGVTTILIAVPIFAFTGATMGSAFATLGGSAALLVLPHGPLEIYGWLLATDLGLAGTRLSRIPRGSTQLQGYIPRMGMWICIVVVTAAAVETVWTNWYMQHIGCRG